MTEGSGPYPVFMPKFTVRVGDCLSHLRLMADESIHCCVTSPPYFGLRSYYPDRVRLRDDAPESVKAELARLGDIPDHLQKWFVPAEIGLEPTPEEFVSALVAVFREVRRVLRSDGTLWLNLGDTMNNRRRIRTTSHQPSLNGFKEESWAEATKKGLTRLSISDGDLKEKDTMGVPWMVAFALRADGWYLRQEIIWCKSFGKPEPAKDRLPGRHEQLFLLTRDKTYYFDKAALPVGANGSVWSVAPAGSSDHGAAFAPDLISPCVLAGCPVDGRVLDPFGGSGTTAGVALKHGRRATVIELNPEYADMMEGRVSAICGSPAVAVRKGL